MTLLETVEVRCDYPKQQQQCFVVVFRGNVLFVSLAGQINLRG